MSCKSLRQLFFLAFCLKAFINTAQDNAELADIIKTQQSANSVDDNQKSKQSASIKLAYHNSIFYPGLRLGLEFPVLRVHVTKQKKEKTKIIYKERYLVSHFSWYYHPGFHSNYYFTVGGLLRRTKLSGMFWQSLVEAGFSRTFNGASTYEVLNNTEVERLNAAGHSYFAFMLGGGLGYDFSLRKEKPIKIYLNLQALFLTPYNSSIYPRGILEFGVIYTPLNFLRTSRRIKTKSK